MDLVAVKPRTPMSATTAPTPNVGSASDTAAALLASALSAIFFYFFIS
jgi:hypothetical protein